ncbi:hypothetical protein PAU_01838 [Photorhabdus asymbiotica]|uniref:Uncharacterized protein n=1 Tax=Photorhabdus asymbiotica subsp. asymbiotica (strain ATCC 43949 / 3105-77) TaxID=553480 RepID=C7BH08_PHOAA|nr:hypothetical protein PAU_01838 [Photorhabdus asymbiotica]
MMNISLPHGWDIFYPKLERARFSTKKDEYIFNFKLIRCYRKQN